MKVRVRWCELYADVSLEEGNTKIDLGLLKADEREALAQVFREAIEDLRLPVCVDVDHGVVRP